MYFAEIKKNYNFGIEKEELRMFRASIFRDFKP